MWVAAGNKIYNIDKFVSLERRDNRVLGVIAAGMEVVIFNAASEDEAQDAMNVIEEALSENSCVNLNLELNVQRSDAFDMF